MAKLVSIFKFIALFLVAWIILSIPAVVFGAGKVWQIITPILSFLVASYVTKLFMFRNREDTPDLKKDLRRSTMLMAFIVPVYLLWTPLVLVAALGGLLTFTDSAPQGYSNVQAMGVIIFLIIVFCLPAVLISAIFSFVSRQARAGNQQPDNNQTSN